MKWFSGLGDWFFKFLRLVLSYFVAKRAGRNEERRERAQDAADKKDEQLQVDRPTDRDELVERLRKRGF